MQLSLLDKCYHDIGAKFCFVASQAWLLAPIECCNGSFPFVLHYKSKSCWSASKDLILQPEGLKHCLKSMAGLITIPYLRP